MKVETLFGAVETMAVDVAEFKREGFGMSNFLSQRRLEGLAQGQGEVRSQNVGESRSSLRRSFGAGCCPDYQ